MALLVSSTINMYERIWKKSTTDFALAIGFELGDVSTTQNRLNNLNNIYNRWIETLNHAFRPIAKDFYTKYRRCFGKFSAEQQQTLHLNLTRQFSEFLTQLDKRCFALFTLIASEYL